MSKESNVVLIGMPGCGKSTLGHRLARQRGLKFIDTDLLVEQYENAPIQQIVNRRGFLYLRKIEADILSGIEIDGHVIATGGSAVYSRKAMDHLGEIGVRIYLSISLTTLMRRVNNNATRGLAKMPQHSLPRLYHERLSLYADTADIVVDNNWPMTAVRLDSINKQLDEFLSV